MSENKKTMEISQSAVVFFAIILLAMVGLGGFLYGKVNTLEKTGGAVNTQSQETPAQPEQPTVTMDQVRELFDGKNISFGKKDSKLVFVEFSDPSCPFCHVASGKNPSINKQMDPQTNRFVMVKDGGAYVAPVPEMKKLVDEGKASFVWLYANGHGSGTSATKALYCAHEKGKFWEVHDLLMSDAGYTLMNTTMAKDANGGALDNAANQQLLVDLLKKAVDGGFIKDCLASKKYDDRLTIDMATAQKMGFNGTPNFFVNTTNFVGAYSFVDMQSAVDAALK